MLRIDDSAVAKYNSLLLCQELLVFFSYRVLLDRLSALEMFSDYFLYSVRLYLDISGHFAVVVIYIDDWLQITCTYASRKIHIYRYILLLQLFYKFSLCFQCSGGDTAATLSNYYFHIRTS